MTARGGNLTINADKMSLGSTIRAGRVALMPQRPGRQIAVGAGAADDADTLGLQDTELALMTARTLQIGAPEGQSRGITITPGGMDFSAILAADGELRLNGGSGDVILKGNLVTPGTLFIQGRHLQSAKGASATAPGIRMQAHFGIGSPGAPFVTRTALLAAANQSANGEAPIYVANTGDLTLESVQQNGTGNQGSISVSNDGAMQVNAGTGNNAQAPNIVTGGKGSVTLTSNESLSILGDIATDSGAVELAAGNSGVLAIGAESSVSSKAGNIELGGVAVRNDGAVATATGDTHISAPTVSGDGTFTAPAGDVTGQAPGLPTLKVCIATPTAPGCMAVLPTLSACSAAPATEGCAVVLPTVAQCADSPTLQGCAPVLEPVTAARGNQLEKAVKVTINTLAQSKENVVERPRGDKDEEQNDIAPVAVASLQGEKNNAIPKTYCN